jgi:predicted PurR-regulated permease PerM
MKKRLEVIMEKIQKKFYLTGYIVFLLVLIYALLNILSKVQELLLLLFASIILAYILVPLVRFFQNPIILRIPEKIRIIKKDIKILDSPKEIIFQKQGMSKAASIVLVYLILLLPIILFSSFIIPKIIDELSSLIHNMPTIAKNVQDKTTSLISTYETKLPENYKIALNQNLDKYVSQGQEYAYKAASYSFNFVQKIISAAVMILIIPLFTFYILLDIDSYKKALYLFVPNNKKEEIKQLLSNIDKALGKYVRGQLIVSLLVGIAITIALLFLKIDYAFLIGLVSGLFNFVPYLGVLISLVPSAIIAFINHGIVYALITIGILELVQLLEGHVITPSIMGEVVGLPPLVIIIALIIGAQLMGLMGMLIAIPLAAIIRVTIMYYVELKQEKEDTGSAEPL